MPALNKPPLRRSSLHRASRARTSLDDSTLGLELLRGFDERGVGFAVDVGRDAQYRSWMVEFDSLFSIEANIDRCQVAGGGAAESTVATFTECALRIVELGALVRGRSFVDLGALVLPSHREPCQQGTSTNQYSKTRSKSTAAASATHRFVSQVPLSWVTSAWSLAVAIMLRCFVLNFIMAINARPLGSAATSLFFTVLNQWISDSDSKTCEEKCGKFRSVAI